MAWYYFAYRPGTALGHVRVPLVDPFGGPGLSSGHSNEANRSLSQGALARPLPCQVGRFGLRSPAAFVSTS